MKLRSCLAVTLTLVGGVGGVALWRVPLIVRSGAASVPVGPDTIAHDAYLSVPDGLPFAFMFVIGLGLLVLPHVRQGET